MAGVPFYLRTGKRWAAGHEIALVFKRAPHLPFDATMTDELARRPGDPVQPDEASRFGSAPRCRATRWKSATQHGLLLWVRIRRDSPSLREADPRRAAREPSLFPVNQESNCPGRYSIPRGLLARMANPIRTSPAGGSRFRIRDAATD